VKITVVKTLETGDLFDEHASAGVTPVCTGVNAGQVFVSKGETLRMPEGFCSWAWADIQWADIQRDVVHLALGGDFPWMKQRGTTLTCCTDGLRPVIFKLERF
jgi:uncharacterized repeat protein (TIGR04076 family)